jgi:hypothetical protein
MSATGSTRDYIMATALDLKGKRFGSLTALDRYENDENGRAQWVCVCDCGGAHIVRATYLREGRVTRCPECVRNDSGVLIEAWYHTTLTEAVSGGYGQGAAGFCVATRQGTVILEPFWLERQHIARRPAPVLVETVRKLAAKGDVKCALDNVNITRWLKRNAGKITYHVHNEGDAVWRAWHHRTGEWLGPARA